MGGGYTAARLVSLQDVAELHAGLDVGFDVHGVSSRSKGDGLVWETAWPHAAMPFRAVSRCLDQVIYSTWRGSVANHQVVSINIFPPRLYPRRFCVYIGKHLST